MKSALRRLALSVFFGFVAWSTLPAALANKPGAPLQWSQGSVHVRDGEVSVQFPDGEILKFDNLRTGPTPRPYSRFPIRVTLHTFADGEAQTPLPVFSTKNVSGKAVEGAKVVRLRTQKNSTLIWFFADSVTEIDEGRAQGGVFATPYNVLPDGRAQLIDLDWVAKEFRSYPNEIAITQTAPAAFLAAVHDNWSGTLGIVTFTVGHTSSNRSKEVLNHYKLYSFALPAGAATGARFSDWAELRYTATPRVGSLEVKLKKGGTLLFPLESNGREESEATRWERWKINTRMRWEFGLEAIRTLLGPQPERTSDSSKFENLFKEWKSKGVIAALEVSSKKKKKKTEGMNLLVLQASETLLAERPQLAAELPPEVIELAADQPVFYVHFPERTDISQIGEWTLSALGQIKQFRRTAGPDAVPLFFFDITQAQRAPLPLILQNLGSGGFENAEVVVLSRTNQEDILGPLESLTLKRSDLFVDRYLGTKDRAEIVSSGLRRNGHPISAEAVRRILLKAEKDGLAETSLSEVLRHLLVILDSGDIEPSQPDFETRLGDRYLQISGEQPLTPFPKEVLDRIPEIPRMLSTRHPGHSRHALSNREGLLRAVERRIRSWAAYGYQDDPVLPMLFAGDTGTGKSSLTEGLAQVLKGDLETVNMGRFAEEARKPAPPPSYFFDRENASEENALEARSNALSAIRTAAEKLILSPNPVKILLIDELHLYLEILPELLPALGSSDRLAPGVLPLKGIIVVLAINVDLKSPAYQQLLQLPEDSLERPALLNTLFQASMRSPSFNPDEKLLIALAGRLLSGMFFFPPMGTDAAEQESLLDTVIGEYESKHRMRMMVPQATRDHLQQVARSFVAGNFRAVKKALREELNDAFARFKIKHPDTPLKGYFTLGAFKNGRRVELELTRLTGDAQGGARTIAEDGLARFIQGVEASLHYAISEFESGLNDPQVASLARCYQLMLNAFRIAMAGGLEGPFLPSLQLPAAHATQLEIEGLIGQAIQDLFKDYADYSKPSQTMKGPDALLNTVGGMATVLSALRSLQAAEQEESRGGKRFSDWVESIRASISPQLQGSVLVAPGSVEALAVAAGAYAADLARRSAQALHRDLAVQAREESLQKPMGLPKVAETPGASAPSLPATLSSASAECLQVLNRSREAFQKVDRLLGKKKH